MENFTNEQLQEFVRFYEKMGVSSTDFFVGDQVKNIFDFLGIKPEVDENGHRKLTPYELLGILPNFDDGVEKPIVFFVKNKVKNIKLVKINSIGDFVFSKEKNKDENSLIDFVLSSYRTAIMQNNLAEAERHFEMLDKLTGGKAKHYIGSFYDYTKFYKQMKKQLLIDLFSHFFLLYLMQKKSIIKKGLIIKNKRFKAYKENKSFENQIEEMLPQIKSVRIDEVDFREEEKSQVEISESKNYNKIAIKQASEQVVVKNNETSHVVVSSQKGEKSFIKKFTNKLFRKNHFKSQGSEVEQEKINPQPSEFREDIIDVKIEKEVIYE